MLFEDRGELILLRWRIEKTTMAGSTAGEGAFFSYITKLSGEIKQATTFIDDNGSAGVSAQTSFIPTITGCALLEQSICKQMAEIAPGTRSKKFL